MLLAMACLGDSLLTLTRDPSINPATEDDSPPPYTLTHTDLRTNETKFVNYSGENDALLSFVAWIAADDGADAIYRSMQSLRETVIGETMP